MMFVGDFMKEQKFVKTSDEHTADILRKAGLHEIAREGKLWVFINEVDKIDFSSNDMRMIYSDKLFF